MINNEFLKRDLTRLRIIDSKLACNAYGLEFSDCVEKRFFIKDVMEDIHLHLSSNNFSNRDDYVLHMSIKSFINGGYLL